jgi:NADPH-dependent ferric siderophore reductase
LRVNARPDARAYSGTVTRREVLGDHLVRVTIDVSGFASTGVPDEWVALTVPGQFQTRYYTVRAVAEADAGSQIELDVVIHDEGLVTQWAQTECVGDVVGISEPKGSFELSADASWMVLVGDLTGLPAIARIGEWVHQKQAGLPVTAYVETADHPLTGYTDLPITWVALPDSGPDAEQSRLAALVRGLDWPDGPGYFWMAGESAQMREIRRHVRHDLGMSSTAYDVMGYWSASRGRQRRAVDPGPIYAAGKAVGKSDEQIWDDYDKARGNG